MVSLFEITDAAAFAHFPQIGAPPACMPRYALLSCVQSRCVPSWHPRSIDVCACARWFPGEECCADLTLKVSLELEVCSWREGGVRALCAPNALGDARDADMHSAA